MKEPKKPTLPSFGSPSKEVGSAATTCNTALLIHAMLRFGDKGRVFQVTPEYEHAATILRKETERRLRILLEHYAVPSNSEDAGFLLAASLARDLVPGFDSSTVSRRGRPRSVDKHLELALAITHERAEKQVGILRACQNLRKRNGPWKNKSASDLQAAFYRFKKAQLVEPNRLNTKTSKIRC
jgi:hypothetical protein